MGEAGKDALRFDFDHEVKLKSKTPDQEKEADQ